MLAAGTVHYGGSLDSTIAGETYAYFDVDFSTPCAAQMANGSSATFS